MTPLGAGGAPLQSIGLGLAVVEQFSPATVAASTWTLLLGGALTVACIAYYHFFEHRHVRWSAWILPMALWVFHSRSLTNYFTWLSVIAVVVIVASVGGLRGQEVHRPCAE
jgi:phosphoglycerol transferase MdoB-like AlkP superfamily enzyme